jgi:hypothetical protein
VALNCTTSPLELLTEEESTYATLLELVANLNLTGILSGSRVVEHCQHGNLVSGLPLSLYPCLFWSVLKRQECWATCHVRQAMTA